MSRSLRRGLLTAAAVWAVSAAAGSEWDRNHDDDRKWLASTVVVTSTVLVDLKDVDLKCQRGEIVCGPTPPPFPDPKPPCHECEDKWHTQDGNKEPWNNQGWNKDEGSKGLGNQDGGNNEAWQEDPYHGQWQGCSHDNHCPQNCNCSPKAICENTSGGPQCKSSTDCEDGNMCNSYGYCQPIPGPRCHEKACESKAGSNCNDNKDCSHGEVCNNHGFCQKVVFPDCENNWDCDKGQICTHRGICKTIDQDQCTCDTDCGDGQICNSQRTCEDVVCPKCQLETECEDAESCHEGFCKPKENKCEDKHDCKDGEICDWEGKCRRGEHLKCKVDSECKWGQTCDIHGRCQHRAKGEGCGSDADCDSKEFCNAYGYCEKDQKNKEDHKGHKGQGHKDPEDPENPGQWCRGDDQCLPGEFCSDNRCVGRLDCRRDSDCRDAEVCEQSLCVNRRFCTSAAQCNAGEECRQGECRRTNSVCRFDFECSGDEHCSAAGICEPTRTCLLSTECEANQLCILGECLTTCVAQADCDLGETCDGGICLRRRFCTGTGIGLGFCQVGEVCFNNFCQAPTNPTCTFDVECGAGQICDDNVCVAQRTCLLNTDCLTGELCSAGTCLTACDDQADCDANETCNGSVCLRRRYCQGAGQCGIGEICQDNFCAPLCGVDVLGDICTDGFSWAHYKLARSPDDSTTTPGTIPIHPADVVSAETWPVLQFAPNVALQGQTPDFTGVTANTGILQTCPPEQGIIYGTVTDPVDYTIVQQIGYFVPATAGTYTLTAAAATLDQSLYVWFGADAQAGYTNTNADLVADANWLTGSNIDLEVVSAAQVGTYIPMRILWVNAQDCGQFDLTITGPGGEVLVSRGQATTDGQFVTNCAASPDIPVINF
ncbi:proteinase inhibitor [Trichoderma longibrachiatum]